MFRHYRKNLIYVAILVVPFLLFFNSFEKFSSFKFFLVNTTTAFMRVLSFPVQEIKKILYYHKTFDEYKRLNREVSYLKARLIGLEEVIRENNRLEKLLVFKRSLIYSSVGAHVIGRDPSYWNSSIIIDKGSSDGVKVGQAVVESLGIVGKVIEVSPQTSKVILLTDPQFSVAALIQGPREFGLVSGSLEGVCRLSYINQNADIRIGDKVITSKLSASFPEGLVIGEIIRVDAHPKSSSVEYIIKPQASLSQIEEVLIILK